MPRSPRPPDRPGRGRESFTLEALRDFTSGMARAQDFNESLRVALMVLMGTFSVAKGVLFLEEDGEFRACASRGLPPGVPPVERTRRLAASLGRARLPVSVRRSGTVASVREVAARVEKAVPAFEAETFCPFPSRRGLSGFALLGPSLLPGGLSAARRKTLAVMTSFLASHVSHHRVVREVSALNVVLRSQVRENGRLLRRMREIFLDSIRALAAAIEAKDPYTRGHSERVAGIAVEIARELGLPDEAVQAIRVASIMHDVGKIATNSAILVKAASLTRREYREIRRHPQASYDILSEIRFPYPDVARLARHHHEKLDGSGYPDGKRGKDIPLGARIIAVADAFDAMVSDRPYRTGLSAVQALSEIRTQTGRHYDPVVAESFFRLLRKGLDGNGGVPPASRIRPRAEGAAADGAGNGRERLAAFLDGALTEETGRPGDGSLTPEGSTGSSATPERPSRSALSGAAPRSGWAGSPRRRPPAERRGS